VPRNLIAATLVAGVVSLGACAGSESPSTPSANDQLHGISASNQDAEATYIIVFKDGVQDAPGLARQLVAQGRGRLGHTYQSALKGFSASFPAAALEALRHNPNIALIEADQEMSIVTTQLGATWGLDRIDQRSLPLSTTYTYDVDGTGVHSYILDTGIRASHTGFGGRVSSGYTAITDGRGTDDCNGHGTHVAGTVGSSTWGVAKNTDLVAVRVLGCNGSGTNSGVIAGIDWVAANHVKPAVANMSLGGGASSALDAAVANAVAAGVTFVVSGGNSNANACNYSPARAPSAITVGATTSTDARASYSNFGTCLDIFAPGSGITSAWSTSNTATNTISGTSMASPHVAGAAALYLQDNPNATPAAVTSALIGSATANTVTSPGTGSPNRLLFVGAGTQEPPPPPTGIALTVNMTKVKGNNFANLSWSGHSGNVDLKRNGTTFLTTGGTTYSDAIGKGGGSRSYQVCNAGTSTCSAVVNVSY
jgi:subtilisin family serine protease